MSIRLGAIPFLQQLFGSREAAHIVQLAKKQETLEAKWRRKMKKEIERITEDLLKNARVTGRLNFSEVDFRQIVMEHSLAVMEAGIRSAQSPPSLRGTKLGPPPASIPKSLKGLRKMWDQWKTRGKMPPRQKKIAEKLHKAYTQKVQSVWVKYGEEFRTGKTASVAAAVEQIQKGADVSFSRAKMIVDTETTYYYNKARREVYDESPDVTHYLFVAIRDHATTKWCKTRTGLVYKKGSAILEKETPPIHWNCRSEILPLTKHNPVHLKLIADLSKRRENNTCFPLPPGWTARSA